MRKNCKICGEGFQSANKSKIYCSEKCKEKGKPSRNRKKCCLCGTGMGPKTKRGYCNKCSREYFYHGSEVAYKEGCRCAECSEGRARRHRDYVDKYRSVHGEAPSSTYRRRFRDEQGFWPGRASSITGSVRAFVYERDGWVCQICLGPISKDYFPGSRWAPSLDHIVPRSAQSVPDDSADNLRMAHMICNAVRGARDLSDSDVAGVVSGLVGLE